jgi:hypothetical protein
MLSRCTKNCPPSNSVTPICASIMHECPYPPFLEWVVFGEWNTISWKPTSLILIKQRPRHTKTSENQNQSKYNRNHNQPKYKLKDPIVRTCIWIYKMTSQSRCFDRINIPFVTPVVYIREHHVHVELLMDIRQFTVAL